MTDAEDNIVLRLLREIRGTLDQHTGRFERIERKLDEIDEKAATALGLAASANVVSDRASADMARVTARLEQLERRIGELEARP